MDQRLTRQGTEIGGRPAWAADRIGTAANLLILFVPLRPALGHLLRMPVCRDAAVHLMKGSFAEQQDQLAIGKLQRPRVNIQIDETAAGEIETLVQTVQGVP